MNYLIECNLWIMQWLSNWCDSWRWLYNDVIKWRCDDM